MKPIGIVTDSHSGIAPEDAQQMGIYVLPMPFYVDEECFYEGVTISRASFFEQLEEGKKVSTSQPSPDEVMKLWNEVLKEYESILYMPISSGLSGSCDTAKMLAAEPEFSGKVFVVDHGRVATSLRRTILDAMEYQTGVTVGCGGIGKLL